MRIIGICVKDADETALSAFWNGVSEQRRNRIMRLMRTEDRVRSLVGDALARWMLADRTAVRPEAVRIAVGPRGKPFWPERPDVHFNLSHSGDWVVAVVADAEVGIDIEQVRPPDFRVAERFFAREEYSSLMRLPDERARTEYFFELWTIKESYVKALGAGLSHPFDRFAVRPTNGGVQIVDPSAQTAYYARSYPAPAGYKLAVCCRSDDFAEGPTYFGTEELLRRWNRATGRGGE